MLKKIKNTKPTTTQQSELIFARVFKRGQDWITTTVVEDEQKPRTSEWDYRETWTEQRSEGEKQSY